MVDTATVLKSFYESFGLPAFTTDNVPDDQELPYLTYRFADTDWEQPISHYCQIYMRTRRNVELLNKAKEIKDAIGTGKFIPCGDGYISLHYENAEIISGSANGAQSDQDSDVRSVYISMQMDVLHS